jgi:hypothetical protein
MPQARVQNAEGALLMVVTIFCYKTKKKKKKMAGPFPELQCHPCAIFSEEKVSGQLPSFSVMGCANVR